uniref:Pco114428 n=1 Tax=Arundo donax TaxID=35708 RepID=A0A0A9DIT8_ARUDO
MILLVSNSYLSTVMFICDVDVFSTKFNSLIFSTSSIPKANRLVSSCSSNCIRMLWIPA